MRATSSHYTGFIPEYFRMAIYMRDNFRCLLCQRNIIDGIQLALVRVAVQKPVTAHTLGQFVTTCLACATAVERTAIATHVEQVHMDANTYEDVDEHLAHIARQRKLKTPLQVAGYHVRLTEDWACRLLTYKE